MVSVQEFVEASIASHPVLFTNRTEVLHFVLCVNGNGYDWGEDGVPVYLFSDYPAFDYDVYVAESLSYFGDSFESEFMKSFREQVVKEADEFALISSEAAVRASVRGELTGDSVYPQSKYALLSRVPENVPEDWREACEEIRELAVAAGWVI